MNNPNVSLFYLQENGFGFLFSETTGYVEEK